MRRVLRSRSSAVCRWLAAGALAAVQVGAAHAVEWSKYSDFLWKANGNVAEVNIGTGNGTTILDFGPKPTAAGTLDFGGAKALPWSPQPKDYDKWAKWKASIQPKEVAKAMVSPKGILGALASAGAAAILKELADEACVRLSNGQNELRPGVAWDECVKADPGPVMKWATTSDTDKFFGDPEQACLHAKPSNYTYLRFELTGEDSGKCMRNAGGTPDNYAFLIGQRMCGDKPAKFVNGAWVCNTSGQPGQPTGQYRPVSSEIAEQRVAEALTKWTQADFQFGYDPKDARSSKVVQDLLNRGASIKSDPVVVSGPSQSEGTTTSTTSQQQVRDPVTGETKTVNTTTNTTTYYNYTYNNTTNSSTVTRTETTKKEECAKDSASTGAGCDTKKVEETTKTDPKAEDTDLCKLHPEIIACQKFGEPPEPEKLSKKVHNFDLKNLPFAEGQCPEPVRFEAFGVMHQLSYDPACGIFAMLKPLVLLGATLIAAWIIADGFRV